MSTTQRDYYEVLGIERTAGEAEIKKAFRGLARSLHPDVSAEPDAEARFREVVEAYEVLSKPEARELYDRYGHAGLRGGGFTPTSFDLGSLSPRRPPGRSARFRSRSPSRAPRAAAAEQSPAPSPRPVRPAAGPAGWSTSPGPHSENSSAPRRAPAVAVPAASSSTPATSAKAPAGSSRNERSTSRSRPESTTASRSGFRARATRARSAEGQGISTSRCGSARTLASCARETTSSRRST